MALATRSGRENTEGPLEGTERMGDAASAAGPSTLTPLSTTEPAHDEGPGEESFEQRYERVKALLVEKRRKEN